MTGSPRSGPRRSISWSPPVPPYSVSLKDIAEKSLMQTRRPVLLAPQTSGADLTAPAMIAWDESVRNAGTRCLRPFPSSGSRVPSTSSASTATRPLAAPRRPRRSPICAATASSATARVVAPHLRSAGDTLLAEAAEHDVCLLVMGAYSHSPLREMLLGGATRHVLKNAVARPVLMAH